MATFELYKSYSMATKLPLLSSSEPESEFGDNTVYVWKGAEQFEISGDLTYDEYSWEDSAIDSVYGTITGFKYIQGSATTFEVTGLNLDLQELISTADVANAQSIFMGMLLEGDDEITGTNGKDTLYGYDGDDLIDSGGGADTLVGGNGDDWYFVSDAKTKIIENANEDIDTVVTNLTTFSLAKLKNVEDLMYDGESNAILTGSTINNYIEGSTGNDTLDGGLGEDYLVGNDGNDVFKFTAKLGDTNVDTIHDFTNGEDTILLSKKIFKALSKGITADNFVNGTIASEAKQYLIYDQISGELYYDADGSGTKSAAIQIAVIGNNAELTFADFSVA